MTTDNASSQAEFDTAAESSLDVLDLFKDLPATFSSHFAELQARLPVLNLISSEDPTGGNLDEEAGESTDGSDTIEECADQESAVDTAAVAHIKSIQRLIESRLDGIVQFQFRAQTAAAVKDLVDPANRTNLTAPSLEKHLETMAQKRTAELTAAREDLKRKLEKERDNVSKLQGASVEEIWSQCPETRALYKGLLKFLEQDRIPYSLCRFMAVSPELPVGSPFRLPMLPDGETVSAPSDYHAGLLRNLNTSRLYEGKPYLDLSADKAPSTDDFNKIVQIQNYLNELNAKTMLAERQYDMKVNFPREIRLHGLPDWLRGAEGGDRASHAAAVRMLDIAISIRKCAFAIQHLGLDSGGTHGLDPTGWFPAGGRSAIPYPPGVTVENGKLKFSWPGNLDLTDASTAKSVNGMVEWLRVHADKVQQALDAQSGSDLLKQVRFGDVPGNFAVKLDEAGTLIEVKQLPEGTQPPEGFRRANLLRFNYEVQERDGRFYVTSVVQASNSQIYLDFLPGSVGACARTPVGPVDQPGKPGGYEKSDILPVRNCSGRTLQLTADELSTHKTGQWIGYTFDKASSVVMDVGFLAAGMSTAGGALIARGSLAAAVRWKRYITGAAEIFAGGGALVLNHAEGHTNPALTPIESARGTVVYCLILRSLGESLYASTLSPDRRIALQVANEFVEANIAAEVASSNFLMRQTVQWSAALSESSLNKGSQIAAMVYVGAHMILERLRHFREREHGELIAAPGIQKNPQDNVAAPKAGQQSLDRLISLDGISEFRRESFSRLIDEVKGVCGGGEKERKDLASDLGLIFARKTATEAEKRVAAVLLMHLSTARGDALRPDSVLAEGTMTHELGKKVPFVLKVQDTKGVLERMSSQRENADLALFATAVQAETGWKTIFQEAASLEEFSSNNSISPAHRIAALTRLAMISNAIRIHETGLELKARSGTSEDALSLSEHLAQGYKHGANDIANTIKRIAADTKADTNVRLFAASLFAEIEETRLNFAKKAEVGDIAGNFNKRANELAEIAFRATERGVTADKLQDDLVKASGMRDPSADPARTLASQTALHAFHSSDNNQRQQYCSLQLNLVADCLNRITDVEEKIAQAENVLERNREIAELNKLHTVVSEALSALPGSDLNGAALSKLLEHLNKPVNGGNEAVLVKLLEQVSKITLPPAAADRLTRELIACLAKPENAKHPAFRAKVISTLADMNRVDAANKLIDLCTVDREADPIVRLAALEGLEKLKIKPDQTRCKRILETERDPAARAAFLRLVRIEDPAQGPKQVNAAKTQSLEKGQSYITGLIANGALPRDVPSSTIRRYDWSRLAGRSPYDQSPLPPQYIETRNQAYDSALKQFTDNLLHKSRLNTSEGQNARLALLEIIATNGGPFTGDGKQNFVMLAASEVCNLLDPAAKLGDSAINGMDSPLAKVISNGRVDPEIRLRLLDKLVRHALANPQHVLYVQSVRECISQTLHCEMQTARENEETPERLRFRRALFSFIPQLEPACETTLRNIENSEIEDEWRTLARDTRADLNHSVLAKFEAPRRASSEPESGTIGALRLERMLASEASSTGDCVSDIVRATESRITESRDQRRPLIVRALDHKLEMVRIAAAYVVLERSGNAFSREEQQAALQVLAQGFVHGREYGYKRDCQKMLSYLSSKTEYRDMASIALAGHLLPDAAGGKVDQETERKVVDLLRKHCPEGTLTLHSKSGAGYIKLNKIHTGRADQTAFIVERIDQDNRIVSAAAAGAGQSYQQTILDSLKGKNTLSSVDAVQSALSLLDGDAGPKLTAHERKSILDELQVQLNLCCEPRAVELARSSRSSWPPAHAKSIAEYFEQLNDKSYVASAAKFRDVVRANRAERIAEAPRLSGYDAIVAMKSKITHAEQERKYGAWLDVATEGLNSTSVETRQLAFDAIARQPKPSPVDAVVTGLHLNRSMYPTPVQNAISELYEIRQRRPNHKQTSTSINTTP